MDRNITRLRLLGSLCGMAAALGLAGRASALDAGGGAYPVRHSDDEWRKLLGDERYDILRRAGTEAPFSSPLDHETRSGVYVCAGCANRLYSSATKFDSGTGWPSFYRPLPGAVLESRDTSLFMVRTEVHCARCGGHLGHVFDDGPPPTGLRYCMNGLAMVFRPGTA